MFTYYGYGWTMTSGVKLDDICLLWAWLKIGHRAQASQYSLTSSGSQTCWADSVVCWCSYSGPVGNKMQLYSHFQETESDWAEMSLDCGNRHQQTKSPEIMLKIHLWLSITWCAHLRQCGYTYGASNTYTRDSWILMLVEFRSVVFGVVKHTVCLVCWCQITKLFGIITHPQYDRWVSLQRSMFFHGSPCKICDDKCVSGCPPTTTAVFYQLPFHC